MRLILEVQSGADTGRMYELSQHGYRAVGRQGDGRETVQFEKHGDRALDQREVARAEAHLAKKPLTRRHSEPRLGTFIRDRDILLEDANISRTHAMFFLDDEGASVVDLLSTNGTHVNGRRVEDADLAEGDEVTIGRARFRVHLVE